jgi:hypothetical protein
MNIKRNFGTLLMVLGISGLIYSSYIITRTVQSINDNKMLVSFGVLGFLFFSTGISLVRTTKDES